MLTPGAYEDRQHMQVRLIGLRIVTFAVFVLLAIAFWNLQVLQFQTMREQAENNHMRTIELRAPRGVLFDRHGEVLVQNRRAFRIALVREQVADLDAVITRLAATANLDEADVRATIKRRRSEPAFRPIPIIENASPAQVAAVLAQALELPGIVVEQIPTRTYPADRLAAHLFGYVGEAQEAQLTDGLTAGAIVGQAGIESTYNRLLMGRNGNRFVVVNTRGREIKELEHQEPVDGLRLQLTLDADVQRALEGAFHNNGYNGAGMVLDPRTGEVLAATSLPAYDPNDFAVGVDNATWRDLTRDTKKPLNNRLVQGLYAPGSTFKIVMALAALQERLITPETKIFCGGSKVVYGRSFACAKAGGHGFVNVEEAIQHSCNVFFYTLGEQMPIDTIHKYAARLGLVGRTGIDLPNERESIIPSEEWKRRRFNDRWYPGETISVAIGQGYVTTTPVALARMIATVANGGQLVTPHVVKAVDEGQGWQPVPTTIPPPAAPDVPLSPQWVEVVRQGLWRAVNDGGSGRAAKVAGRDVVGKTGTAQVISLDGAKAAAGRTERDLRHHGWFVFFAPADAPEIAGVIFAEHGGSSGAATPIARHVLETYFAKKDGLPLPQLIP
ncbi:MAG: penicillin-binding protein 2, partial [Acidobacteria bacterium]|nr:penicillin-binding protein 2 [Acidobacteriota bacterium]